MSITGLRKIFKKQIGTYEQTDADDRWIRPVSWLDLGDIPSNEQKILGLVSVFDDNSNFVTFRCTGAITVDWGDGTATENIASNTTAQHNYVYSALNSNTEVNGYRQAKITITPQSGQNITAFNLRDFRHTTSTATHNVSWLEIKMRTPSLTSVTWQSAGTNYLDTIRNIEILDCAITNMGNMFNSMYNLERVYMKSSGTVTSMAATFQTSYNIKEITLDITIGANCPMTDTYGNCWNLKRAPRLKFASNASISDLLYHFGNCHSLIEAPSYGNLTSAATRFQGMFSGCRSLISAPWVNTSAGTNLSEMFDGCWSLKYVPDYNTASNTTLNIAFRNCYSLRQAPAWNVAAVTTFNGCFIAAYNLERLPSSWATTTAATVMSSMFQNCWSLQTIPAMDTDLVTTFATAFDGARSLRQIPALNMTGATSSSAYTNMFRNALSIGKISATNIKFTFSVANMQLSATQLDALYTNLPTVTSQTITVSGNYGVASDTPSIAQAKGWTVTG